MTRKKEKTREITQRGRMGKYFIPDEFGKNIDKGMIFISGVGRSGTTILGKIMGSMADAHYFFEPAIIKLLPFLNISDPSNSKAYTMLFRSLLTEDYLMPVLQGRSLNFNPEDDSYFGNYTDKRSVEEKWGSLSGRNDLREYLRGKKVKFVIKIPEFQPLFEVAQKIFPGAGFMHIIRNGRDVVSSSVARGWFSDRYMRSSIVEWLEPPVSVRGIGVPWYLDDESKKHFPGWDPVTRAACVWRVLTEAGMDFCRERKNISMEFRYEDFVKDPQGFTSRIEKKFGTKRTAVTERHLRSIREHSRKGYADIVDKIKKPEREKFVRLMDKMSYLEDGKKRSYPENNGKKKI